MRRPHDFVPCPLLAVEIFPGAVRIGMERIGVRYEALERRLFALAAARDYGAQRGKACHFQEVAAVVHSIISWPAQPMKLSVPKGVRRRAGRRLPLRLCRRGRKPALACSRGPGEWSAR